MEENNITAPEKPNEETLKYWLDKALNDNKQLVARLRQVTDALNILPHLLKIVELDTKFNSGVVERAKAAISDILFSEEHEESVNPEV